MMGRMKGDERPCESPFFRNSKGNSFTYGIGKDLSRFKEKFNIEVTGEKPGRLDLVIMDRVSEKLKPGVNSKSSA